MLRVLAAWLGGDRQVCSMVRVPTPEEEDGKRPHREREPWSRALAPGGPAADRGRALRRRLPRAHDRQDPQAARLLARQRVRAIRPRTRRPWRLLKKLRRDAEHSPRRPAEGQADRDLV